MTILLNSIRRLSKCLIGKAKETVSLLIYPDNVQDVIEELEFSWKANLHGPSFRTWPHLGKKGRRPRIWPSSNPSAAAASKGALGTEKERYNSHQASAGGNPCAPRDPKKGAGAMSKAKPTGRDDETQALAIARAEEELLLSFQRSKQKVHHSPPAGSNETHPMSAPPKMHAPIFTFDEEEEEVATPKRCRDAASPDGKQTGANKKQRVEANTAVLVERLGAMLDEMVTKFTDTKGNNKKVVRHVTQGTIDAMIAMKKLQLDISASLAGGHTKGSTACASQQTTPMLSGTAPSATPASSRVTTAWQQVKHKPKPKAPHAMAESRAQKEEQAPRTMKPRKQRSDAILIKCSEGSYADMLRIVKTEPSLQGLKEGVQGLRRTANGGLLVRMQKSLDPSTQQLQAALKTAISGKAEVTVMQETVQVEIRDLDDLTSGEEVTMALFAGEDCDIPSDTAPRMRKAFGGTQIATVSLRPEHARRLLEKGKIRIGWVVCRIREKLEPRRCYKCMGFGHTSARCRASEATAKATQEACFKCGGTGHKHYTCQGKPRCILCTRGGKTARDAEHATLSRICPESAQDLLTQTVSEQNIDVAILSEPYRPKPEGVWQQSTNGGAAIWSCGQPPCHLAQRATRPGYARAKFQGTTIYSCYLAPSLHTDEFREIVQEIAQDARGRSPVIIAGDFNAWSTAWGSTRTTQRGTIILDAFSTLDVCLLNDGRRCTFRKSGRESYIDLTFASPELTRNSYWEVTHLLTYSDHAAIVFQTRQNQLHQTSRETAYRVHTLNSEVLLSCMDANTITGEANTCADVISARIKAACDAAMEKSTKGGGRRPVPWWNQEIASARSKCLAARRKCQRSRGRTTQELYESRYREMKKALKVAIRTSKHKCFQELCDAADKEPFGSAYKMVTGKLTRQPTPTSQQHLGTIVDTLFPPQPPLRLPSVAAGEPIPTCEEEVLSALTSCQASKAPGPDGIPNAALHAIVKAYPKLFVQLYNTCIAEKTFPRAWKQQRLVLIPKPGKLNDDPSSFRPLCMLNTIGKIFERIIGNKLEREIEERGALSTHQHGFRKKRSTIDAIREVTQLAEKAIEGERWQGGSKKYCLVCTLDVKNAFNSANWSLILQALQRGGISGYIIQLIADYFKDRVLLYSSDAGKQIHHVTGGVPQGSVLGPLLWNVMYDDILRLPLPEGCSVIGFADDIALVTVEKHLSDVSTKCSHAIDILMSWLADNGLSLAEQKTEAVLISSRKIVEKVNFRVGSTTIESSPTVKYLGVLIDHRLNYKCHLEYAAAKASKATAAISRMMANTRGPRQHSRRLISTVVTSTLLYAAPIWSEAMLVASYSRQCRTVYRRCALRISSCFCTVSEEAALVVAGSIPIDLLAAERRTGNSGSRTQRSTTVARWQARWDNASTGRWTHRLIPDLDQWIHRRHGFKHEADPSCDYCGGASVADAEHAFFECPLFRAEREAAEATTNRRLTPETIIGCMLETPSNWDAVTDMAATVMRELRRREQTRRTEGLR
ncbi:uncharacterized protein [Drosophila kikkawai]|uniref:Reverse transcriptase n=2 Tax=Drosophila kikkawai TaxID=30033 RepID=A0ABM4GEB5_DROKI